MATMIQNSSVPENPRSVSQALTADSGYEHQGKRYRSLSGVARAITGTQWSGPLFFGLRKTGTGA